MRLPTSTDVGQLPGSHQSDSNEDSDLEVRMYSELYFEPNPHFAPRLSSPQTQIISRDDLITSEKDPAYYKKSSLSLTNNLDIILDNKQKEYKANESVHQDPEECSPNPDVILKENRNLQGLCKSTQGKEDALNLLKNETNYLLLNQISEDVNRHHKAKLKNIQHTSGPELSSICKLKDNLSNRRPSISAEISGKSPGLNGSDTLSPVQNGYDSSPAAGCYVFSLGKKSVPAQKFPKEATRKMRPGMHANSSTPLLNETTSQDRNSSPFSVLSISKGSQLFEFQTPAGTKKKPAKRSLKDMSAKHQKNNECEVILIDSDDSTAESSSVSNALNDSSHTLSNKINAVKRKLGVRTSQIKPSSRAGKRLPTWAPTKFIPDDSSDSGGESLENGSMLCNFSVDLDGSNCKKNQTKRLSCQRTHWPMDYASSREQRLRTPSVPHWSQHMTSFYDSDFSEDYELEDLHRTMPDSVIEWELDADDYPDRLYGRRKPRYFEKATTRCSRCRAHDHTIAQCKRLDHCLLCGDTRHSTREKCPRNCCLRCGGKPHAFCPFTCPWNSCEACGYKGHVKHICPDLWRRYAFTTEGAVPQRPRTQHPTRVPTCYSCGGVGHEGAACGHRVQHYVQQCQDIRSFAEPTRDCLGLTVLTEELPEQDNQPPPGLPHPYGETVQKYTTVRASVALNNTRDIGHIIGKQGSVIKALRQLFSCQISVEQHDHDSAVLWVKGAKLDAALRCILFMLGREAETEGVKESLQQLDRLTYSTAFTSLWTHRARQGQNARSKKQNVAQYQDKLEPQSNNKKRKRQVEEAVNTDEDNDQDVDLDTSLDGDSAGSSREYLSHQEDESNDSDVMSVSSKRYERNLLRDLKLNSNSDSELESWSSTSLDSRENRPSKTAQLEDSKYAAFDQLQSQKLRKVIPASNCYSHSGDSDFGSEMNELSDSDSNESVIDASDVSSDDDANFGSKLRKVNDFNLKLSVQVEERLRSLKRKRYKSLLDSLPVGRKSLIHEVKNKLSQINRPIDIEKCLVNLRESCLAYSTRGSDSTLNSALVALRTLGTYVLGGLGRGDGKSTKKEIERRVAALERSTIRMVGPEQREGLARALDKILNVDVSSLKYVVSLAERSASVNSKPSVQSRLSFPGGKHELSSSFEDKEMPRRKKRMFSESFQDRDRSSAPRGSLNKRNSSKYKKGVKRMLGKLARSKALRSSPKGFGAFKKSYNAKSSSKDRYFKLSNSKYSNRRSSKSPNKLVLKSLKRRTSKSPNRGQR
ncbi:uncharacterized protein LOC108677336 [Hyalella azteca]|uniref:Uncharacterized protein LOC108677336 n=1 Tax=Hyalella azteca TaxID=294128 RepID=A0A8B7P518_HYAAZ|nr:uncharacterized protein LOC108677336 [Hyalella azteca]